MASNTEHLNLLKKDPVADGNEYFNIETMLNENWDKIDEAVSDVQNRLNRSSTESITLQPGLQTINAERTARFKLGKVRGRTLINLLGKRGECEATDPSYYLGRATLSVDTAIKHSGAASLKLVSNTAAGSHYFRFMNALNYLIPVSQDEKVLFGAWVKPLLNSGASVSIFFFDAAYTTTVGEPITSDPILSTTSFSPVTVLASAPAGAAWVMVQVNITDGSGQTSFTGTGAEGLNLDSAFVYKLSDAEYAALDGMTNDQITEKYPFVPVRIIGVENPYAISESGNLLPPFYEWVTGAGTKTLDTGPYQVTFEGVEGAANVLYYRVSNIIPDRVYTYQVEHNGYIAVTSPDGEILVDNTQSQVVAFNSGSNSVVIVNVYNNGLEGFFTFKNPMLSMGTESKPFEPQRKSVLAWQTELHANPTDGSEPDVLFEQDGQYYKLEKWKKVVLDGALLATLSISVSRHPGYKQVNITLPTSLAVADRSAVLTKFNGALLTNIQAGSFSGADQYNGLRGTDNLLTLTISNSDSGWGPDYSPMREELDACFNGWKMYQEGSRETPYTSGKKQWFKINKTSDPSVAETPTSSYAEWTPYQILYRLAKETVEPVMVEGCLTLSEGDNTVEVGTGIVLQESVKPKQHANTNWVINNMGVGTTLSSEVAAIKAIYRDSRHDYKWIKESVIGAWGNEQAYILNANYDQSATYTVTYTKLDKSPIVPMTGSLATNENAQISDLTSGVAEALQRTSVLERQKAEKDAPSLQWIMPTLLNGWKAYADSRFSFRGYAKDGAGNVLLSGLITGASSGSGVPVFYLPEGYRPNKFLRYATSVADNTVAHIQITNEGQVTVINGNASSGISLTLQFPAER